MAPKKIKKILCPSLQEKKGTVKLFLKNFKNQGELEKKGILNSPTFLLKNFVVFFYPKAKVFV